jgi:hypothetical protein
MAVFSKRTIVCFCYGSNFTLLPDGFVEDQVDLGSPLHGARLDVAVQLFTDHKLPDFPARNLRTVFFLFLFSKSKSGVNVMATILCDFRQFSVEKIGAFLGGIRARDP